MQKILLPNNEEAVRDKEPASLDLQVLRRAPSSVTLADGSKAPKEIPLERKWRGALCRSKLTNTGTTPLRIQAVTLFSLSHTLPPETGLYGEGFQMLSQTGGTLGRPLDLGGYTDPKHYRLMPPEGAHSVYNLLTLAPPGAGHLVIAFTSCRRFSGRFDLRESRIDVVMDTEGRELAPGETWELEEFQFLSGADRAALLQKVAARINRNHPPLRFRPVPTGWCSWYCFGPGVTEPQVRANLETIARDVPGLKYIQIDDGYQAAMGDWLETGRAFGGDVRNVLQAVRKRGFQPAIWVAPFIAEENSRLFREHPDWFIQGSDGKPLRSDTVTFGGWRNGPWYALDGTHPGAQEHLESVFRTMSREWGCTYFKLDANFWGAMHGGRFYDPKATRVEAYRRGMQAVLRGAGSGSFLLGCNHPLWPSLGLIHGSRSSGDISRNWNTFEQTARENLSRNWQNGRLWWNDPDCLLLTGDLSEEEFRFHATALFATGGMLLSGDDLTRLRPDRLAMLHKLLPPSGNAARFTDGDLRVGVVEQKEGSLLCLFNWGDTPQSLAVHLPARSRLHDFWTDQDLGEHEGTYEIQDMPAHSARLLNLQIDTEGEEEDM